MSLEDFKTVLIIQSIENSVYGRREEVLKHQNRMEFVQTQKQNANVLIEDKIAELKKVESLVRQQEKDLSLLEKEINIAKDHILDVKNEKEETAIKLQIKNLSPKIDLLEEDMFNHLENIDQINELISSKRTFVAGIEESIETVKNEVEIECSKENKEIDQYKVRRTNLLDSLPPDMKSTYLSLKKRYKEQPALSFRNDKSCSRCGFEIDGQKMQNIESQHNMELCSGCGRIIIPNSAK